MRSTEHEAPTVAVEPVVGPYCNACGDELEDQYDEDGKWTACPSCNPPHDAEPPPLADQRYQDGFNDGIRAAIACAIRQSQIRYAAPSHYSSRAVLARLVETLRDVRPNA